MSLAGALEALVRAEHVSPERAQLGNLAAADDDRERQPKRPLQSKRRSLRKVPE